MSFGPSTSTGVANPYVWGNLQIRRPSSEEKLESKTSNDESDSVIPLIGEKFTIGRAKNCNYEFHSKLVSKCHCYLKPFADSVHLYDSSSNGTVINRCVKVTNGKLHVLQDRDEIYLINKKDHPDKDICLIFRSIAQLPVNDNERNESRNKRIKLEATDSDSEMNDTQIDETDKYEIQDEKHKCQKSSSITSKSFNNGESAVQQNSTSASVAASETVVSNYLKDEPSVQPMVQEPTATTHTNSSTLVVKTEPPSVEIIDCDLSDSTQPLTEEPMSDVDDHPDVSDNGDRKNDNPAANSNSTKLAANENDVDGIEETLQCSLCIEILHEPVCVQPCLHCYCAGCYSQWMKKSPNCPQCRVFVQSLSKNHIVSNLVEAYLRSNPEKQRIAADIEKLNQSNTIKMDVMKFSKTNDSPENNYDSYESDSTDGDDGDGYFSGKSGNIDYPNSSCRQCYKNSMPGIANLNQPSTSTNKGAADKNLNAAPKFFCKTKQSHISCFCCQEVMPDRLTEKDAPPQQCTLCYMFFCHLYFGCTKADCRGCLNHFKDLKFNEGDLVRSINNNVIETRILLDFLTSSSKDWKTCFQECLAKLDARLFTTVPLLNSNSVICYTCGMRQLKHLLYTYRSNIQKELLPNEVTSRPDCYWGKNCRTQHHKMNHAERYNHICEQTRFH